MKVSEFIQELRQYPQDALITFSFGEVDDERMAVALAITDEDAEYYGEACDCLDDMKIGGFKAVKDYQYEENQLKVILKQDFYTDEYFSEKINEAKLHFDEIRRKKEEQL